MACEVAGLMLSQLGPLERHWTELSVHLTDDCSTGKRCLCSSERLSLQILWLKADRRVVVFHGFGVVDTVSSYGVYPASPLHLVVMHAGMLGAICLETARWCVQQPTTPPPSILRVFPKPSPEPKGENHIMQPRRQSRFCCHQILSETGHARRFEVYRNQAIQAPTREGILTRSRLLFWSNICSTANSGSLIGDE